ncbi:MAG: hypothetical protein IJF39_04120 [Clostridia bacterium]|nr:hypothetical protein [Clostridia bacterium]
MNEFDVKAKELSEKKRKEALVAEVKADFERRREARRSIENGWLLNMRFLSGDQYCDALPHGGIVAEEKKFYWQTRRVYNRIAPIVDARMSKLTNLRPTLQVRAFSDEESDVQTAKLSSAVLEYVQDAVDFPRVAARATLWAETCGSAFYKIAWNDKGGRQVSVDANGVPVYEGEVCVSALSAFEVFPDRLDAESIDELHSLIHAQIVAPSYVLETFGVAVEGEKQTGENDALGVYAAYATDGGAGVKKESEGVLLIERYVKPSTQYPDGRLEIVAGDCLLYEGGLPYLCGDRNERGFPFVKQDCLRLPGAFFGQSVIHRLIPLQRAYNAVRNRKHEFLNRLAMGIVAVEDGSIDCDELAEEGLAPGKVIVFRQGSQPPQILDVGGMPAEFAAEEEWLEKEFTYISGVSDLARSSTTTNVTSASGLQLLLSQDDSRLAATMDSVQQAVQTVGRHILRLYRQLAGNARLMTLTGENKRVQLYYFNASELPTADIRFVGEVAATPAEKRETLLSLFTAGLLTDEDGKVPKEHRNKILDAFGFGDEKNARDISALHVAKASDENVLLLSKEVDVEEFDDHALHVNEHTRYLLSSVFEKGEKSEVKERVLKHLRAHKAALQKNEVGECTPALQEIKK